MRFRQITALWGTMMPQTQWLWDFISEINSFNFARINSTRNYCFIHDKYQFISAWLRLKHNTYLNYSPTISCPRKPKGHHTISFMKVLSGRFYGQNRQLTRRSAYFLLLMLLNPAIFHTYNRCNCKSPLKSSGCSSLIPLDWISLKIEKKSCEIN